MYKILQNYTLEGFFMEATNISLTKQHLQKLRQNKKETGVPTSTLIRQLLDKYFEEKDSKSK